MFTNQFFDLLLHLDDTWQVTEVKADHTALTLDISIVYIGKTADCPRTAVPMPIYDHAPERRWRHLDTMQYITHIRCRLPRVLGTDGKVLTVAPPWADRYGRQTHLFEHAVIDLLLATKNQTRTAHLMRCGFNVINRYPFGHGTGALQEGPGGLLAAPPEPGREVVQEGPSLHQRAEPSR